MVNKSVPSGAIVAGNPAKIIGWVKDLDYNIFENPKYKEGIAPYLKYENNFNSLDPRTYRRSPKLCRLGPLRWAQLYSISGNSFKTLGFGTPSMDTGL